jgi:hypothetical protein
MRATVASTGEFCSCNNNSDCRYKTQSAKVKIIYDDYLNYLNLSMPFF